MTDCITTWSGSITRCSDHHGRNPCAIDGCKRTCAAPLDDQGQSICADDQWFCADHWRRYVPPRSRTRRAYLAFFRQARKHGWGHKGRRARSARLDWRFRRFWTALVAQARRRAADGYVDEAAINRLMGWE